MFSGQIPTTSGQATTLFAGSPNAYAFVLLDRDPSVAGPDTLYIADQNSSGSGGGLVKYSYNGTTWTARSTAPGTLTGLTGVVSGGTAVLYATSGTGAANTLVKFTDSAAFDANISGSFVTLAIAPAGNVFRGVAFTPAVALPTVALSVSTNAASETAASAVTVTDSELLPISS